MQNRAAKNLNQLLDKLGIEYVDRGNVLIGRCPIHPNSDNPSAFNIYKESTKEGYPDGGWVCNTRHCEKKYPYGILGLVIAKLQIDQKQAIKWLCNFCGCKSLSTIKPESDKSRYNKVTMMIENTPITARTKCEKPYKFARSRIIPAPYFIKRGVPQEILKQYMVGYNERTEYVDVPIFDNMGDFIVGHSSRSIYEKCPRCKTYHSPKQNCPTDLTLYPKWKHIGIAKRNFLYNYWFASELLKKSGIAILVESPGNVWKLIENNILNCVACLGSFFSDHQDMLLSLCGVRKIYILGDNDQAGRDLGNKLEKRLIKRYNIQKIYLSPRYNDIMEAPNEYVQQKIIPQIIEV